MFTQVSIWIVIALQLSSGAPAPQPSPQWANRLPEHPQESLQKWHPGTFRGLKIGTMTRRDMYRMLGKPQSAGPPTGQRRGTREPEIWHEYQRAGEFAGTLTVVEAARTGIIQRIDVYPEDLSQADAIKRFGDGYVLTHYDFDECLGDEESAPIYESPSGSLLYVEYRKRGIAIAVDEDGTVTHISYVNGPIGGVEPKCPKLRAAEKRRRELEKAWVSFTMNHLQWGSAVYRDLAVGRSTDKEMLKVLGKPDATGGEVTIEGYIEVYQYHGVGKIPGIVYLHSDGLTGTLRSIVLFPEELSRQAAIAHFGRRYTVATYRIPDCKGVDKKEEGSRLEEAADGELYVLEYRKRGIAIILDDIGRVKEIQYVSASKGIDWPECK